MQGALEAKPPWQRVVRRAVPGTVTFGEWKETPSIPLLQAKGRISALDAENRWELVKKMVNPYELVFTHEDKFFHPSIALIKPLSRSYFKMIEMMRFMEFFETLPKQQPKIRSAHIAEGPGGFIQALVELCERNKKILHSATAMTLKPVDQRVPGWRRATNFLRNHREVRLHFGADGTGDVYKPENQDSFVEAATQSVNIFTADGGFDFSVNYDIQERRVFHLLVSSAVTGLRCLAADGVFILKIFDIFSDSTRALIILISQCFQDWTLYKPSLSRPCNSERYLLCRGFRSLPAPVLQLLQRMQTEAARDMYLTDISGYFTKEEVAYFEEHSRANIEEQMKAIEQAEIYANHPELWYTNQLPVDFQKCKVWCERYRIPYSMKHPIEIPRVKYDILPKAGSDVGTKGTSL
jgi:23S rRNA U2552 (ribose-2'-O)-methylase RlmE/FtsJ